MSAVIDAFFSTLRIKLPEKFGCLLCETEYSPTIHFYSAFQKDKFHLSKVLPYSVMEAMITFY